MPDRFDIVVAGAGHSSLIATAYLAKASYRCLAWRAEPLHPEGIKTAELTLRGFRSSAHVLIQDSPTLRNGKGARVENRGAKDRLHRLPVPLERG